MKNWQLLRTVSLALGLTLSCSTSKVQVNDTAGTGEIAEVVQDTVKEGEVREPEDTDVAECGNLDQEACEASDACMAIESWAKPAACLAWDDDPAGGLPEFVECVDAAECGAAFTWARPADSAYEIRLFPTTCIPTGWNMVDEAPCCQSDCEGKECGDDGCGGTCGTCPCESCEPADSDCAPNGQCVGPCQSDCIGKVCGDDGCGGSCGDCPEDMMCHPDNLCGPVECPLVLQNATTVRLAPMHLSPDNLPGHALDLDLDGQPDNGFPTLLAALLPLVDDFFDEPLDLSGLWMLDISDIGDDPHPLLVMENFNTDGVPFTVTFHYGLLAENNADCIDVKGVCSYLVDPDLFIDSTCEGKVVLEDAVVQGGKLHAGGPNAETWWVYVPGRLYMPASAQAHMLQLQADVEVTSFGVHLTNGLLGFATSFQHFMHRGGCYAQVPNNPVSCEILPPLEDPYHVWYDTEYGVSVTFQFVGHPAKVEGICQPDCAGKPPDAPDGCGGPCHYDKACAFHAECSVGQLCLRQEGQLGQPTDVCGLCADGGNCACGVPSWPAEYECDSDTDCADAIECGDQCDDCPLCPACISGWCAYDAWDYVECLCTGCA